MAEKKTKKQDETPVEETAAEVTEAPEVEAAAPSVDEGEPMASTEAMEDAAAEADPGTAEEDAAIVAGLRAAETRLELNLIDLDTNRLGFASIVTAIAMAGNTHRCQYERMNCCPSPTIWPHDGVGGLMPTPMKDRAASVKIASGMPKVTATTIGVSALGRM